ncbi:uncharacterized protein EDB91DRAFT_1128403, partial [Suillus paluster]|uniref:uncharacterized protein n=1 Tax=Suillus paluster TaxID=48578 RepID=UPI001B877E95
LNSDTRPKEPLPLLPPDAPEYFRTDIPVDSELISIIQNDWPYSVPIEIEHTLIWSQDGLCGFTGNDEPPPPPSPSTLPKCLPAVTEWGITMENLVRSPKGTPEIEEMARNTGREIDGFVDRRWAESE